MRNFECGMRNELGIRNSELEIRESPVRGERK
jgi:hypothetical protein